MFRTFLFAALVAAAVACATDATPPTRADLAAQCEARCVAIDGSVAQLDGDQCVCQVEGPAEKAPPGEADIDSRCTSTGCARVCAPGSCASQSSNDAGGCTYYCIAAS